MTFKIITGFLASLFGAANPGPTIPTNTPQRIVMRAPTPAVPVVQPSASVAPSDLRCLASAMWFEARGEPRRGQIAVGEVVLGRTHDPRFPHRACAVIAQRSQFSFVHGGQVPRIPVADAAHAMEQLARRVIDGVERSGIRHALFFHARRVHPGWEFTRLGTIGEHVFYAAPTFAPSA